MKKFFFLVILFLSFSGLYAQNQPDTNLFADSRALQFQIGSNFNLSAFDGGTISYKMNVSPYEAWRFGVTLRLNTSQSGENSNMITNVNGTPQSNSSETTYSTLLNAYYIKYVPAKRYVYFY